MGERVRNLEDGFACQPGEMIVWMVGLTRNLFYEFT